MSGSTSTGSALLAWAQGLGRRRFLVTIGLPVVLLAMAVVAVAGRSGAIAAAGVLALLFLVAVGLNSRRDVVAIVSLLSVCLFLIPEDYVFSGPLRSFGYPPLLLAFLLLAMWFVAPLSFVRHGHPVHWVIFAYVATGFVSYGAAMTRPLTGVEISGTTRSLAVVLAEAGIGLAICEGVRNRKQLDRLLFRIVVLVGLSASIGIVEFVSKGFDYRDTMKLPGFVINVITIDDTRSTFHRVQAGASHPIEYAVACAAMVPVGLHYATYGSTRRQRQIGGAAALAMMLVLPMTVSRSPVLALAASVGIYAAHWSGRARANALILALFGLVGFRAAVPGLLGTLKSLFAGASSDPSVTHRTNDYAKLPALLHDHWLIGRGLGTFQWQQYFYLDNEYLYSLLEGGLLALGVLLMLFVVSMSLARGARKASVDPSTRSLGQALAGCQAAFTLSAVTFDEMSFKQTAFLVFIVLAISGVLWTLAREEQAAREAKARSKVSDASLWSEPVLSG